MHQLHEICRPVKEGRLTLWEAWHQLAYADEFVADVVCWRLIGRLGPELGKELAGPGALHIVDACAIDLTAKLGLLLPCAADQAHAFCESYPLATAN